ncbi:thioredoxin-like protein [Mycena leptocephala]|nr:thioredoxin-like protein [Mycena leptocephala]
MASSSSNLVNVADTLQFQSLLSADLDRVSLINFWAPWAAPCAQMNDVVAELAKKHPSILALNVEAEQQADIAESFDIEAVPLCFASKSVSETMWLQGHTLLARVAEQTHPALTEAITKHTHILCTKAETPEFEARLRRLMAQSKVVLFMKGSPEEPRCGFSRKLSTLLKEQGVQFSSFDILQDEDVRQGLKKLNDWPTFPQLIVNGELVGGLDIVQEMVETASLPPSSPRSSLAPAPRSRRDFLFFFRVEIRPNPDLIDDVPTEVTLSAIARNSGLITKKHLIVVQT